VDSNQIQTLQKKAADVDFEELFKDSLPADVFELQEYTETLVSKNVTKGWEDIKVWQKNGEEHLNWAKYKVVAPDSDMRLKDEII
jgi:hypothetical protein